MEFYTKIEDGTSARSVHYINYICMICLLTFCVVVNRSPMQMG